MWADHVESAPGSVAQVRAAAHELTAFAKRRGVAVILVGHVTKDGQIAGPRVVEHMVDTVLYFEGERGHQFRILRAVKNRFGPADEIGVFEMTGAGLAEVANPSALFLSRARRRRAPARRSSPASRARGRCWSRCRRWWRPRRSARARRAVVGWDAGRLAMVLAVLEARCGIGFAGLDVYLNVAGGLRITEPAADLAVAAALVSARQDVALPRGRGGLRRDQPVGRAAADRAGRGAAARGGEARLRGGLRAGGAAGAGARRAGDSPGCGPRRHS